MICLFDDIWYKSTQYIAGFGLWGKNKNCKTCEMMWKYVKCLLLNSETKRILCNLRVPCIVEGYLQINVWTWALFSRFANRCFTLLKFLGLLLEAFCWIQLFFVYFCVFLFRNHGDPPSWSFDLKEGWNCKKHAKTGFRGHQRRNWQNTARHDLRSGQANINPKNRGPSGANVWVPSTQGYLNSRWHHHHHHFKWVLLTNHPPWPTFLNSQQWGQTVQNSSTLMRNQSQPAKYKKISVSKLSWTRDQAATRRPARFPESLFCFWGSKYAQANNSKLKWQTMASNIQTQQDSSVDWTIIYICRSIRKFLKQKCKGGNRQDMARMRTG